ncbi:OCIA domain-containing protein 1-like isoform X2 [Esox lucius]|uniref:OCIA domain-containing protein 1-like isoform X2 n=1 Tax=Esox lucius TaxID=8010 RepID=UPI0010BD2B02|nr:OCIA domain-containing protein 1-like isoform X2 [Esox lucius]
MTPMSTGYPEERKGEAKTYVGMDYTEDEKRVFRECVHESFWYRSVPFSVASMLVTQGLIHRGILTSSSRFGSLPKVAFAGLCGFLAGKMAYVKHCQEKFKRLENSTLGEALGQRTRSIAQSSQPKSEMSDPDQMTFDPMFQVSDHQSQFPPQARDHGYPDDPAQTHSRHTAAKDNFSVPDPSFHDDEEPRRKPVKYEDLRNKNRENYEVTLTQRAETLLKPEPTRQARTAPRKDEKKNIYGDSWDQE